MQDRFIVHAGQWCATVIPGLEVAISYYPIDMSKLSFMAESVLEELGALYLYDLSHGRDTGVHQNDPEYQCVISYREFPDESIVAAIDELLDVLDELNDLGML